jgi:hypothetical protein
MSGQRDQERLFLRKSLVHHPVGRSVNAEIGDLSAPLMGLSEKCLIFWTAGVWCDSVFLRYWWRLFMGLSVKSKIQ